MADSTLSAATALSCVDPCAPVVACHRSTVFHSLELVFGSRAEPLLDQVRRQGFTMSPAEMAAFQHDADAILRLHVQRLITDVAADRARRRLTRSITHDCKPCFPPEAIAA